MAEDEQPQGLRNKGALIAGAVLGVIVVILYNVQIARIKSLQDQREVQLVRALTDLAPGQVPDPSQLETVSVTIGQQKSLGNIVTAEDIDFLIRTPMMARVNKGQYISWDDVLRTGKSSASAAISDPKYSVVALKVDPDRSVGNIVSRGDYVDIMAVWKGKTRTILRAARVVTVGGEGQLADSQGRPHGQVSVRQGQRRFSEISVEVLRAEQERLNDVVIRLVEPMRFSLLSPEVDRPANPGTLSPDLGELPPLPTRTRPRGLDPEAPM